MKKTTPQDHNNRETPPSKPTPQANQPKAPPTEKLTFHICEGRQKVCDLCTGYSSDSVDFASRRGGWWRPPEHPPLEKDRTQTSLGRVRRGECTQPKSGWLLGQWVTSALGHPPSPHPHPPAIEWQWLCTPLSEPQEGPRTLHGHLSASLTSHFAVAASPTLCHAHTYVYMYRHTHTYLAFRSGSLCLL